MKNRKPFEQIIFFAWFLLFVFLVQAGCGGGGGGNDADTTKPTVISSNPADGESGVSILSEIQIIFSESLDSTTVSTKTAALQTQDGRTVSCIVTYDNDNLTVTLVPDIPLLNGTSYLVILSDLKDPARNTIIETTLSFSTSQNLASKNIFYSGGDVSSYISLTYDAQGNQTQSATYNDAGTDGTWFTADDGVDSYVSLTYD
ncbi:MAG: Ig-like domain-containing protein, partial [bacterium]